MGDGLKRAFAAAKKTQEYALIEHSGFFTYKHDHKGDVDVYLFRKRTGMIAKEAGGWRYWPKGHTTGGDLCRTLQQVKNSLESD